MNQYAVHGYANQSAEMPQVTPELDQVILELEAHLHRLADAQGNIEGFLARIGGPCPVVGMGPMRDEKMAQEVPTVLYRLRKLVCDLAGHADTAERHAGQTRLIA